MILYILLCGTPPFNGPSEADILQRVVRGVYSFSGASWAQVSSEAKALVRKMLTKDPATRPTAEEVLRSPWICTRAHAKVQDNQLATQTLQLLSTFQAQWKLRQATLNYIAAQLVSVQEVTDLRQIFLSLDTDGDGKLSIEELVAGFESSGIGVDINQVLTNCDADGNGFIEYTEFLTATLNWQQALSHQRLEAAFRLMTWTTAAPSRTKN